MIKYLIGAMLAGVATLAWAQQCSTHTYMYNGKMVVCTTCCYYGGNCNTTCF